MPRLLSSSGHHVVSDSSEVAPEDFGPDVTVATRFVFPTYDLLPVPTYDDGEIAAVPVSGVIAVTDGGVWQILTADRQFDMPDPEEWAPDNAAISGNLLFWGNESGIKVDLGTTSGVSGWHDNGPQGNHFAQTTQANQPYVQSGVVSGQDALWFDGNGSLEEDVNIPLKFSGASLYNITAIMICEWTLNDGGVHQPGFTASRSSSNNAIIEGGMHAHWGLQGASGQWRNFIRDTAGTFTDVRVLTNSAPQQDLGVRLCMSNTVDATADLMELFRNRQPLMQGGVPSGLATMANINANLSTIGAYRRQSGPISHHIGRVYEIAIYDTPLSSGQRRKVEQFMMSRWSV